MTKTFKSLTMLGIASVFICASALCGCKKEPGTITPPPEIPQIQYTTDDALISQFNANDERFAPENVTMRENSPLKGKKIYWLGSSVTHGASSEQDSMADYLAALTGCISVKEAVSGTTIFDDGSAGSKSYTKRLTDGTIFKKDEKIDAFICQIPTNDAWGDRAKYRGKMTDAYEIDINAFDKKTTLGGVEFIIAYAAETWGCPVYFYSGSWFGDEGPRKSGNPTGTAYGELVRQVKEVVNKWSELGYDVGVIDLFNDESFNSHVSDEYYAWATSDAIHPKRTGYLQWWTPYFEQYLIVNLTMDK